MFSWLQAISLLSGWGYTAAWSASLWPQAILNYQRQFVGGLSIDFCVLNLLGHASYATYNLSFHYSKAVRDEYERHHDGPNNVQLNDVAFGVHATLMACVWYIQTFYYPREPGQRISTFTRSVISAYGLIVLINAYALFVARTESLYSFVYILSLFKLYVSVAKYIPQAWENYRHQSTAGWAIYMVLLDFSGGVLSFIQLFADAIRTSDWSSISGNPAKFGLSVLSMIFNLVYLIQHYVLYPNHDDAHLRPATNTPKPRDTSRAPDERTTLLGP
ncbi:hypothetical protein DL93DRAFT_2129521 [Clavulina sp. PMI_390]|nr:hypothetical protein DL93DRAFT_2129521 [Clavulina sp. PMI_390]